MAGIGIDGGSLVVYLVCFLIIVGFGYSMWPKLMKAMDARREAIRKTHENARLAEEKLANAQMTSDQMISDARKEAGKIIDDAHGRADQQVAQIIAEASQQARGIVEKAREEAKIELDGVLGEAHIQIANLAIASARRILGNTLKSPESSHLFIDAIIASLPVEVTGLSDVEVTSALPLPEVLQQRIQTALCAKNVTFFVDPTVLGGLVFTDRNDRVVTIDISAAMKLEKLHSSFNGQ